MSMETKLLLFLTLIFKIIGLAKFNVDVLGLCTMIWSTFDLFGPNYNSSRAIGVTKIIGAPRNAVCWPPPQGPETYTTSRA